jgi:diguanylate cyclase (GGDEF)-like protein
MIGAGQKFFSNWFDAGDPATKAGADLLQQRYRSLQKQVPYLYISALSCFAGLHLSTFGTLFNVYSPVSAVVCIVVYRLIVWYRRRDRDQKPTQIVKQLRNTFYFSTFFSISFCVWALYLLLFEPQDTGFVVLFGSLASVGCAYGLSSFPVAARIPLFVLGLPIALSAMVTRQPGYVGLGVALFLIILLVSKVLSTHNSELTQLSVSRSSLEEERHRAVFAETVAVDERKRATRMAYVDHLTGMPNRRSFMASLEECLSAKTNASNVGALAIIDLDAFKPINDAFGHSYGDSVLRIVGSRLLDTFGDFLTCARLGGDEFAVLIPDCATESSAIATGNELLTALRKPISVDNREFTVSGCCGIVLLKAGDNASESLVKADLALYDCKRRGDSLVGIFSSVMEAARLRSSAIEERLRHPETRSLIRLAYQPIFWLESGKISSFEALARWRLPDLGEVNPSEFIGAAERSGFISEISYSIFDLALTQALSWPTWVTLSFNLSASQLCEQDLADRLMSVLQERGMDPWRLEIEVTETVLLVNFDAARRNLAKLRAKGVRVVIDDFGSGYASISYLQEMQFDGVKIDGSLVQAATTSTRGHRLLKGVIDLCANLAVPCVAEHIESEEQRSLLKRLGCAKGQGYLLGCAVDPTTARRLVASPTSVLRLNSETSKTG